jgi:glycosyltransferase involved in cell wall biosynthesis
MIFSKRLSEDSRTPIIAATTPTLSGVTTWLYRLRDAFRDHPKYQVLLMQCFGAYDEKEPRFDLHAPTLPHVALQLKKYAPLIYIPNYLFETLSEIPNLVNVGYDIRCVGVCHSDTEVEYYNPLSWYEDIISQFIVVSPECHDKLTNMIPHREKDITTLIYGIPVKDRLRRKYQRKPIRILYAGRVVQKQKRVMDFVDLIKALGLKKVDYLFNIVGDGDQLEKLKNAVSELAESKKVSFWGRVPEEIMPSIWQQHDVYVQVSEYEGTSISMLEAMSHGTVPVLTNASSGIETVIRPGVNGFIVPVGNMANMANLISKLASKEGWLEALGYQAHQTAKEYSLKSHSLAFEKILDRTIATPLRYWPVKKNRFPEIPTKSLMEHWVKAENYWRQRIRRRIRFTITLPVDKGTEKYLAPFISLAASVPLGRQKSVLIDSRNSQRQDFDFPPKKIRLERFPFDVINYQTKNNRRKITRLLRHLSPLTLLCPPYAGILSACAGRLNKHPETLRVMVFISEEFFNRVDIAAYYDEIISKYLILGKKGADVISDHIKHRKEDLVVIPDFYESERDDQEDVLKNAQQLLINTIVDIWRGQGASWPRGKSLSYK